MARQQKDEFTNLPTHNAPDDIKKMLATFAQLKRDIETVSYTHLPLPTIYSV